MYFMNIKKEESNLSSIINSNSGAKGFFVDYANKP